MSAGLFSVLAACGGVGSTSSSASLTTIDGLPLATGPVEASSTSANLAKSVRHLSKEVNLNSMNNTTFDTSHSIALCEMANRWKQILNSAAQGDRILCYVQHIFAANQNAGVDIYNSQEHVLALSFTGGHDGHDSEGPSMVRLQIVPGADGEISDFKMAACESGASGVAQGEYLHQAITAATDGSATKSFSMLSKGVRNRSGDSGSDQVSVTGTLERGHFINTKTIEVAYSGTSSSWDGYGAGTATQDATSINYTGYEGGSFSDDNWSSSNSDQITASAELIDGNSSSENYDLRLLAIGDGAAHVVMTGTGSDGTQSFTWNEDHTQGWNGDTKMEDSAAAAHYLALVAANNPPAAGARPSIAFAGDEVFDCANAIAEATVTVDMDSLGTACSALEMDHSWVDCWQIIGQDNQ